MSDTPLVNPDGGKDKVVRTDKSAEESIRDTIHREANEQAETHPEKREEYRKRILDSLSQGQDTKGKSPEEIYQDQIKKSYGHINNTISDMWEDTRQYLWHTSGHKATKPTKITDNGTKIYVLDQLSSVSSLIAHSSDNRAVYQMIQLPPIDGKVKIVGLLYSPNGFEMAEIEVDSEEFENESLLRAFIDPTDKDAINASRHNAPILKYFDELSDRLPSSDQSLPFFISPKDVKFLTEIYFPYLSDHPDVLSGPLPDFNSIEATYIKPNLPIDNDPESVKVRDIHYHLEGLVGSIEEAFDLAALERPGSKISFIGRDNYKEVRYGDQFRTHFLVEWDRERNEYVLYKHPKDRPDLTQTFRIYKVPGQPLRGSFNGENKKFLYDFSTFINDLRKTLRQEAETS